MMGLNRWFAVTIGLLALACAGLGASTKHFYDKTEAQKVTISALQLEIRDLQNEVEAEKLAAKLDRQEAVGNYERASDACDQAIRSAVEAVQIQPIEVPRYEKDGSPSAVCPAVRLRDIQAAGGGPFVPTSSDGQGEARAPSPR
jgi:hypothetical protein